MIENLKIEKDFKTDVHFCVIESLSESLKKEIRSKLSALCEGEYDTNRLPDSYSYKNTLDIFLDRYKDKSDKIKKGMIGELLCHLLLPYFFKNFISVSPFFNNEERSIKKGHDLIYFDIDDNIIWAVEVKSGELDRKTTIPSEKSIALLRSAISGIKPKLTGEEKNIWRNALKKVGTSLKDDTVTKKTVEEILQNYHQSALEGTQISTSYNVVLSSSLFHDTTQSTELSKLIEWKVNIDQEKPFAKCIVFSIQKNTYQAVEIFLKEEFENLKGNTT